MGIGAEAVASLANLVAAALQRELRDTVRAAVRRRPVPGRGELLHLQGEAEALAQSLDRTANEVQAVFQAVDAWAIDLDEDLRMLLGALDVGARIDAATQAREVRAATLRRLEGAVDVTQKQFRALAEAAQRLSTGVPARPASESP